ncbi:permease [Ignatzschineria sp. LJL83]
MTPELKSALEMFIFLALELSILFIGISFIINYLQEKFPVLKNGSLLSSEKKRSYFVAAAIGAITPFCSCSTIPMLKGMLKAKAGFGPTMVFLFVSPLLNPIILGLLLVTFGFKLTIIYATSALLISLFSGWFLHKLNFQKYIIQDTLTQKTSCETSCEPSCEDIGVVESDGCNMTNSCCDANTAQDSSKSLLKTSWKSAWEEYRKLAVYLFIGIAIGSLIYGFIPTEFLAKYAGDDNPLAIPFAAIIGIPLYVRAETVIPLAAALLAKGVGSGTVLALIIGSAGASITELILLKSIFKTPLLIAFTTVILTMALIAGYSTYLFLH